VSGHTFIVSGDPAKARDTVFTILRRKYFTVHRIGEWSATADRGSKGLSWAFGALPGKEGRYIKLLIDCGIDPAKNNVITVQEADVNIPGTTWLAKEQVQAVVHEVYSAIVEAYKNAGVLIAGGTLR